VATRATPRTAWWLGSDRRRFWLLAALVVVVAGLLHAPALTYDFSYLDDNDLILDEQAFLARPSSALAVFGQSYFGSKSQSYYRPVVNLSFVIDAQWSGTRPFGYHFTNVVLHAGTCVLVFALLMRLGLGELAACAGALLFAVHPLQTSSVAWIPGRNDVLMTGFALGACLWLLRALDSPRFTAKAAHLLTVAGALFSKETALGLPLLFVCLMWAMSPGRTVSWRRSPWIGWASAIAIYVVARWSVIGLEQESGFERMGQVLSRSRVMLSDVGKVFLPLRLQVLAIPEDLVVWPGLLAIAGAGALVWLVRGVRWRIVALATAFVLVPSLFGLLGGKVVVLECRLYLATVGASILVGEVLRAVREDSARYANLALGAVAALLVVLGVACHRYGASFRDRDHFSHAAIEGSPHSGLAAHLMSRNLGGRPPLGAPSANGR
jgi:protein O-mannosyl-transferase